MTNKDWNKLKYKIEDFEKRSNGLLRFDELQICDPKCRHPYLYVNCTWYEMDKLENSWKALGDVPVSEDDRLEEGFDAGEAYFDKGTKLEDVWHWFDEQHPFGVKYLMYGVRDTSKEAT